MTESLTLELTPAQIAHVVSAARDRCGLRLTDGLPEIKVAAASELEAERELSRSLVRGLVVHASLPRDGGWIGVTELAVQLGFAPSTTHRYLNTLVRLGLAERDPVVRQYRVSPVSQLVRPPAEADRLD